MCGILPSILYIERDGSLHARFHRACLLAGFSEVAFVLEPVAAAVDSLDLSGGPALVFDLGGYLLNADVSRSRVIRHFGFGGKFRSMTGRELEMPRWITDQIASFYALPLADIAKTRAAVKDLVAG